MKKIEFTKPKFLICKTPTINDTYDDVRMWIYAVGALSLIEVISVNAFIDFEMFRDFEHFTYTMPDGNVESYILVFTQDNCKATDNNRKKVLNDAWKAYKSYVDEQLS